MNVAQIVCSVLTRPVVFTASFLLMSPHAVADAESNYLLHCAGCHLVDGSGVPDKVPSLKGNLGWLVDRDEGRDYLARVPGASQAPVTDAELADVINWMLVEFGSVKANQPDRLLSADDVSLARVNVLADPELRRQELWDRYRPE